MVVQHRPEVLLHRQVRPILVLLMIPVTDNKRTDQDKHDVLFALVAELSALAIRHSRSVFD